MTDIHLTVLMTLRWVHITTAMLWIGVSYFMNFVLTPAARQMDADIPPPGDSGYSGARFVLAQVGRAGDLCHGVAVSALQVLWGIQHRVPRSGRPRQHDLGSLDLDRRDPGHGAFL
jgi:hypothetical protein